jgi:mannitol/fructose-specific phosphotransferase system IIA component (Ntr-type)
VEILGVPFCGPCARQQEAYFVIGELTHEDGRDLRSKTLAEVLERKRRGHTGSKEGIAAAMPHGLSGVDETKPLAFRKS